MLPETYQLSSLLEKFATDLTLSALKKNSNDNVIFDGNDVVHREVSGFFNKDDYRNTKELVKLTLPSESNPRFSLKQDEIVAFFKYKSRANPGYKKLFNGITNQETLESFRKLINLGFTSQNIIAFIKFSNEVDFEERLNKLKDESTLQLFQDLKTSGFDPKSIYGILDKTNTHFTKAIDELRSFKDSDSFEGLSQLGFTPKMIGGFLSGSRSNISENLKTLKDPKTTEFFNSLISVSRLSVDEISELLGKRTTDTKSFAGLVENLQIVSDSGRRVFNLIDGDIASSRRFLSDDSRVRSYQAGQADQAGQGSRRLLQRNPFLSQQMQLFQIQPQLNLQQGAMVMQLFQMQPQLNPQQWPMVHNPIQMAPGLFQNTPNSRTFLSNPPGQVPIIPTPVSEQQSLVSEQQYQAPIQPAQVLEQGDSSAIQALLELGQRDEGQTKRGRAKTKRGREELAQEKIKKGEEALELARKELELAQEQLKQKEEQLKIREVIIKRGEEAFSDARVIIQEDKRQAQEQIQREKEQAQKEIEEEKKQARKEIEEEKKQARKEIQEKEELSRKELEREKEALELARKKIQEEELAQEQNQAARKKIVEKQLIAAEEQLIASEEQLKLVALQRELSKKILDLQNQSSHDGGVPGSVVEISRPTREKRKHGAISIEAIEASGASGASPAKNTLTRA